ncbi:mucin-4-like [Schistocerca nitens]|uniref:mucin-4-like n=1 Tax=Schistocerca nitens TaxID=7011 RepID=UPI002119A3AF|nr:mucin-4-like [Schistocerca nitens]
MRRGGAASWPCVRRGLISYPAPRQRPPPTACQPPSPAFDGAAPLPRPVLLGAVLAAAFARPGGMAKDAHPPCSPKRGTSGAVVLKDRIGAVVQKVDAALGTSESVRSETGGTKMSNLSPYHEKLDSSSESKLNANRKVGVASGGRLPSANSNSPSLMSSTPKTAASLEGTDSSETSNSSPSTEKSDSSSESSLNANRKVDLVSGEKLPSASSRAPSETSSTPKTAASVEDIDSSETANSSPSTGKPDSSSESKLSPSHKIDLATGGKLPSAGYNSPSEMSSTSKNAASLRNTDSSETSDLSPYPEKPDGSSESNLNTNRKTGLAVGGKLPSTSSNSPSVMSSTPKTAASLEVTDSSETSNSSPSAKNSGSSSESTLNANRKVDLASRDKLPSASSRTLSETSSTPKTAASLQDTDSSETFNSAPSFERPCSPSESMMDDNSSSDLSSGGKLPLPGTVCPPPKSPSVTNTNNLPKFQTSDVSQSDYKAKDDFSASNEFQSFPVSNLLASSSVKTQESVSKSPDNIASIESSAASVNKPRADSPDSTSFGDLPGANVPPSPSADSDADSPPAVSPRYPTSHFVLAPPATTVLNLKNAYNFWPYSRLLYNHPANTFIVNVPLTPMCSPPSSNNAISGLPISSQFADLPSHRFSPDLTALSHNIMDAVQGAVLANWPANSAVIPQQLSLDDFSKGGAVYNAEDPEDAVDADVDAPPCAAIGPVAEPLGLPADTTISAAPSSSAPNTVTFGGVPVRIWAPPAGPSTSQIPGIINFGSIPFSSAVKQTAAPVNAVQNTINFGGVSVRTLGQPVTVPLSVTSNIISVGGWPMSENTVYEFFNVMNALSRKKTVVMCALLAAALARPRVLLEAAPSPCSANTGAAGAVILRDRVAAIMQKEDAASVSNESTHSEAAGSEMSSLSPSPEKPNSSPGSKLNTYRNIGLTSGSKMPSLGSTSSSQTSPYSKNALSIQDTDSSDTSKLSPIANKRDSSSESKLSPHRKTGLASGSKMASPGSLSLSQMSLESKEAVILQDTDSSEKSNLSPFAEKPDSSSESKLNPNRMIGLASGRKVLSPSSISHSETSPKSMNAVSLEVSDNSEKSNVSPFAEKPDSSSESKLSPNRMIGLSSGSKLPSSGSLSLSQTSPESKEAVSLQDTDSSEKSNVSPIVDKPDSSSESKLNPNRKTGLASGSKLPSSGSNSPSQTSSECKDAVSLQVSDSSEKFNLSPFAEKPDSSSESKLNSNRMTGLASGSKMPSPDSNTPSQTLSESKDAVSLQVSDSSETSNMSPFAKKPDSSSESKLNPARKIGLASGSKVPSSGSNSPSQTTSESKDAISLQVRDSSEKSNLSPIAEKLGSSSESKLNPNRMTGLASGSKMPSPGSNTPSQTSSESKDAVSLQVSDSSETPNMSPFAKKPDSSSESKLNASRKIGLASGSKVPIAYSIRPSQTLSQSKNTASLQDTDSSERSNQSPSQEEPDSSSESKLNPSRKIGLSSGGKMPLPGSISSSQTSPQVKNAARLQNIDSSEAPNSSPSAERADSSSESVLVDNSFVNLSSGSKVSSFGSVSTSGKSPSLKTADSFSDFETSSVSESAERSKDNLPVSNTFQNIPVSNLRAPSSVNSQETMSNIVRVDTSAAFQTVNKPSTSFVDLSASNFPASLSSETEADYSLASAHRYPISSFAPAVPATAIPYLNTANNYWLSCRPFCSHSDNSVKVNLPVTMMCTAPSPNKAIFDIPISNSFPVLRTEDRFLPDIIVVCRKDVDTIQGELLADSPSNCAMTPQQLSLDQLSKVGAVYTAGDPAAAAFSPACAIVDPAAAAPTGLSADTITYAAPWSVSPNTVTFAGFPVRAVGHPTTVPHRVPSNTITFGGWPATAVQYNRLLF